LEEIGEENANWKSTGSNRHKARAPIHGIPFAIKVMQLSNAGGEAGPACVIIAIKGMPEDEFLAFENVLGLSWTANIGGAGFLYLAKTRCGTKLMWMDWFTKVCLPTIRASNAIHKPMVTMISTLFKTSHLLYMLLCLDVL
jgi:hypothetical protein